MSGTEASISPRRGNSRECSRILAAAPWGCSRCWQERWILLLFLFRLFVKQNKKGRRKVHNLRKKLANTKHFANINLYLYICFVDAWRNTEPPFAPDPAVLPDIADDRCRHSRQCARILRKTRDLFYLVCALHNWRKVHYTMYNFVTKFASNPCQCKLSLWIIWN